MSAGECFNVEWAAEHGESVEWARGMWYCPCVDCTPTPTADRVTKRVADLVPGDVVREWDDSPMSLSWTVTRVDCIPVQSFGKGDQAYRWEIHTDSTLVMHATSADELRRVA